MQALQENKLYYVIVFGTVSPALPDEGMIEWMNEEEEMQKGESFR